jgi:hypothetical protein
VLIGSVDPTGETTAQIRFYTHRGQDGRDLLIDPGSVTPAYLPVEFSSKAVDRHAESAEEIEKFS